MGDGDGEVEKGQGSKEREGGGQERVVTRGVLHRREGEGGLREHYP